MLKHALAPPAHRLDPKRRELLLKTLAMIIGTEDFVALTDVVGLDAEQSRKVRRSAI